MRTFLVCFVAAGAGSLAGQQPARLELVRCAVNSEAPCLSAHVQLLQRDRALAATIDSAGERAAWRGILRAGVVVGPDVVPVTSAAARTRLLVLVDDGSSMAGQGIAFVRIALRSWLATLDSTAVRIAVGAFAGKDVRADVYRSAFVTPARAALAVDELPAPDPGSHSALYSALTLGATRMADEVKRESGVQGIVIVFTAGPVEVARGKVSADQLSGASGLAEAAGAIAASRQRLRIVALEAETDRSDLRALAGPAGAVAVIPLDPNAVTAQLALVSRELVDARMVTFGVSGSGIAGLARTATRGAVILRIAGRDAIEKDLVWRPPLIAMPAFQGTADSTSLNTPLREALLAGANGSGNRPLIALVLALAVVSSWVLVPRLAWAEPAARPVPVRDPSATTRSAPATIAPEPVPPRKPEDITHQTARRTAINR